MADGKQMIETFLLCLVLSSLDCTTLHPDLSQMIPRDLLPPDELVHPNPISYSTTSTYNTNVYICIRCRY